MIKTFNCYFNIRCCLSRPIFCSIEMERTRTFPLNYFKHTILRQNFKEDFPGLVLFLPFIILIFAECCFENVYPLYQLTTVLFHIQINILGGKKKKLQTGKDIYVVSLKSQFNICIWKANHQPLDLKRVDLFSFKPIIYCDSLFSIGRPVTEASLPNFHRDRKKTAL